MLIGLRRVDAQGLADYIHGHGVPDARQPQSQPFSRSTAPSGHNICVALGAPIVRITLPGLPADDWRGGSVCWRKVDVIELAQLEFIKRVLVVDHHLECAARRRLTEALVVFR